jgi:hypothetical protein
MLDTASRPLVTNIRPPDNGFQEIIRERDRQEQEKPLQVPKVGAVLLLLYLRRMLRRGLLLGQMLRRQLVLVMFLLGRIMKWQRL